MASQPMIRKLDTIFSTFIRLRDSQNGWFKCCSCGGIKLYEQADAGHFINRRWMATRWREDNVHAQCRHCNRFNEGNAPGYALFMSRKYGADHIEYLMALSKESAMFKDFELQLMINDYKQKVKQMR